MLRLFKIFAAQRMNRGVSFPDEWLGFFARATAGVD